MNKLTYYKIASNEVSYHPITFGSEAEAREVIKTEYTNRCKNDGYDEYWRNSKPVVIKVTKQVLG
jgi:hypothetical protein